jgi:succinyl-diaminopimelate desuccinylase
MGGKSMSKKIDVVELTRKLVAMDTINPPGNEHQCSLYLAGILEDAGYRIELSEFADGRSNLVARLGGEADNDLPICFTGHMDTVPLGNEIWSYEPFGGEIHDGKIYGRGTTDMKGGVAAMVIAAAELGSFLPNTEGVVLILTAGEETGCDGAKILCENPELLGRAGAIVVGEPTSNKPLIGHKGALWLRAISRGITAHGSTPELGVNAVYAACKAVGEVKEFRFNETPHEVIGAPSLNVGRIQGGLNINSVPDYAEFDIDIRTIPSQQHEQIISNLIHHIQGDIELAATVDVKSVVSNFSDSWIQDVYETVGNILGATQHEATAKYFTDASVLTPAFGNPPTIILGPGDAGIAHKTDEYCEVEKLYQAVEIYKEIIKRWVL